MNDPRRWLEEPHDAPSLEQRLVLAGKDLEPPPGAEQTVWAGILPLIGPGTGGGPGGAAGGGAGALGSGAGASTALVATKFLVLGAAVGLGAAAAIHGVRSGAGPAHPTAITSVAGRGDPAMAQQAVAAYPVRPLESSFPAAAAAARGPDQAPAKVDSELPEAPKVANTLPVGTTAMPDLARPEPLAESAAVQASRENQLKQEAMELAQAKRLLAGGQAQPALTLLEQSGQRFPNGALGHEREALIVEALLRSGRQDLGQARARSFLARYPESPLAGRIRKLVGQE
jgi:hypothetical protein